MPSFLQKLWPSAPHRAAAERLYRRAVDQARHPAFYEGLGVPDTLDGRFDMIVMHTGLTVRALRRAGEGSPARRVAQEIFDYMIIDFDRSLRELGVGDMGVPKRIKKMGKAWYGRVAQYDSGIDAAAAGDFGSLEAALRETLYRAKPDDPHLPAMARYMLRADHHLAAQPVADIAAGTIEWSSAITENRP